MNIDGKHYRTIWIDNADRLQVINQLSLPHSFEIATLHTFQDVCSAITDMVIRGAGLIGAAAGYGMWLATVEIAAGNIRDEAVFDMRLRSFADMLTGTRPTARNLAWAVQRQLRAIGAVPVSHKCTTARKVAEAIANEDAASCRLIGQYGLDLLRKHAVPGKTLHVLTHCNAGWLAFVDYGSALAPVYAAHAAGLPVHVWVDETRPRNQGSRLTAWELQHAGIPYDIIADNAGGHLMQQGMVDLVLTGADRVVRNGDVANKIGTYLKALAAADNNVPFYVALPSSTFDFELDTGQQIPVEERSPDEILTVSGLSTDGTESIVQVAPRHASGRNWGFDVTPARLVTGLVTDRGICCASANGIRALFRRHTETYEDKTDFDTFRVI